MDPETLNGLIFKNCECLCSFFLLMVMISFLPLWLCQVTPVMVMLTLFSWLHYTPSLLCEDFLGTYKELLISAIPQTEHINPCFNIQYFFTVKKEYTDLFNIVSCLIFMQFELNSANLSCQAHEDILLPL